MYNKVRCGYWIKIYNFIFDNTTFMLCSNKVRGKYYAKELAALTGNKQQVISRIEKKKSIPTIRTFSYILEALGYELQIVKKESI